MNSIMKGVIHWLSLPLREWLLVLAGALSVLSFAPFDFFWILPFCLALLFSRLTHVSPGIALSRGFCFGIGYFAAGIGWIFISVYFHSDLPLLVALLVTSALVAFMALFPAFACYLAVRLSRRGSTSLIWLLLPTCWVLIEWVRSWFLSGFPWLTLGYSQTDSPLVGYAPMGGVFLVSLLLALVASLLVMAKQIPARRVVAVISIVLIIAVGYGLDRLSWSNDKGKPLAVTLIQGNIDQDKKWLPESRQPIRELYDQATQSHWGQDLIVWPESAIPVFLHEESDFIERLRRQAVSTDTVLMLGVLRMNLVNGEYFNSVVALDRQIAIYDKKHLVPFSESLPMRALLNPIVRWFSFPISGFTAGLADQQPLTVGEHSAVISICFEDGFGDEMLPFIEQAGLLINVTNDGWFDQSIATYQHFQMSRMRAIETSRPLLRSTNTGISALVDHRGVVQKQSPPFVYHELSGHVQPQTGLTPYARWGNWPVLVILLIILLISGYDSSRLKSVPRQPGQGGT